MSKQEGHLEGIVIPAMIQDRAKAMDRSPLERWAHALEDPMVMLVILTCGVGAALSAATVNLWFAVLVVVLAILAPSALAELRRWELRRDWRTRHAVKAAQSAKEYNSMLFQTSQAIEGLRSSGDETKAAEAEAELAGRHRQIVQRLKTLNASYDADPGIQTESPGLLTEGLADAEAEDERAREVLGERLGKQMGIRRIMGGELKDH